MNRIEKKLRQLKRKKRKAFITFITAGDPNLSTTEKLCLEFARLDVDILELGVPFSDPLADGPTIQAASQRALKKGTNLNDVFRLVKSLRKRIDLPIALLTYCNIIYHFGIKDFIKKAKSAGVDGVIIPDLPVEEAKDLISLAKNNNFATIFLVAPTSDRQRIKRICNYTSGFIYYVSLTGTTGARKKLPQRLVNKICQIKRMTSKAVCVGFGISNPEQVKTIAQVADGVIVGSAIVKIIERNLGKKDLVKKVARFVKKLKQAI